MTRIYRHFAEAVTVRKVVEMNRDFKGVFINKELYFDKTYSWSEKILIIEIDSLDKTEEKGCFASNEYLADFIGVTEGTLANMLSRLKKRGAVSQVFFDGRRRGLTTFLRKQRTENRSEKPVEKDVNPNDQGSQKSEVCLHKKVKQGSQKSEVSPNKKVKAYIKDLSNTDSNTDREPLGGDFQNQKPIRPESIEREAYVWLDAIAGQFGAKSGNTMAHKNRWLNSIRSAIKEQFAVTDFLDAIRAEKQRTVRNPEFLTPDSVLRQMQMKRPTGNTGYVDPQTGRPVGEFGH